MEKNNSGAFFAQDKKGQTKLPDFKGVLTLNNEKLFIAVWKKIAKSGIDYYSLSFNIPNSDFSIKDPDIENNKGVLFNNNKKEKEEHSDLQGKCKILGEHYYIDANKKIKNGTKEEFYSFTLNPIIDKIEDHNNTHDKNNEIESKNENQEENVKNNENNEDNSKAFNIFTMGQ